MAGSKPSSGAFLSTFAAEIILFLVSAALSTVSSAGDGDARAPGDARITPPKAAASKREDSGIRLDITHPPSLLIFSLRLSLSPVKQNRFTCCGNC